MKQSARTALGAMITALSVVILIPSALDLFVYTLPAMAGMLTMFAVIELDKKWALGTYAASSILGLLLVPNKEAVMYYAAFFGYYAILKAVLESKVPRVIEYILKFLVFNVSIILAGVILINVFGMPYDTILGINGESAFFAKYALPIMLFLGNIVFILYDYSLTKIVTLYVHIWQKRFRKIFKFK